LSGLRDCTGNWPKLYESLSRLLLAVFEIGFQIRRAALPYAEERESGVESMM